MQSLKLQSYETPEHFSPEAKNLCEKMRADIDKLHRQHKDQLNWLMERFRSAMRKMRPEFITEVSLRELFDEIEMTADPGAGVLVESEEENGKKEKKQRSKKRKAIPDHLPRTIVPHDLPEEEKSGLSPLGFDVKLELKYIRAKFEVLEHRYFKYAKKDGEGIVRCPPEPSIIPQSYASAELLGNIAVSKFCDHTPLYRQEQIYFSRHGIYLTRQVMADWMIKLVRL